jgi:RimJ/RimL family protein N-acetyltransferase
VTPIGQGTGFTGQVVRFSLKYADNAPPSPQTLVAKFPPANPFARRAMSAIGIFAREDGFYRELAGSVNLRVPRLYYADVNAETGDSVLLIEDLAPSRAFNAVEGLTPAEAELVLRALARFHAAWWGSPRLSQYSWLKPFDQNAEMHQRHFSASYPSFLEKTRGLLPDGLAGVGEKLRGGFANVKKELSRPPVTFLHGDFHPNNLLLTDRPEVLAVLDWQACAVGRGARDLCYFITSALSVAARRSHAMDLVKKYHDELLAHAVTGYSLDDCIRDYRLSLLDMLSILVMVTVLDINPSDEGRAIQSIMLERFGAAIVEHRAEELLP